MSLDLFSVVQRTFVKFQRFDFRDQKLCLNNIFVKAVKEYNIERINKALICKIYLITQEENNKLKI